MSDQKVPKMKRGFFGRSEKTANGPRRLALAFFGWGQKVSNRVVAIPLQCPRSSAWE
jgi:hypothetical protein